MFFALAGVTDGDWMARFASSRLSNHAVIWLESYPGMVNGSLLKSWQEFKADPLE